MGERKRFDRPGRVQAFSPLYAHDFWDDAGMKVGKERKFTTPNFQFERKSVQTPPGRNSRREIFGGSTISPEQQML
jgi:hypothetical protein